MHVGKREYVPVVRISMAAGIWKLGKRACTNVSRDIRANESAVSTKSIDCLSKKSMMCCICKNERKKKIIENDRFDTCLVCVKIISA